MYYFYENEERGELHIVKNHREKSVCGLMYKIDMSELDDYALNMSELGDILEKYKANTKSIHNVCKQCVPFY